MTGNSEKSVIAVIPARYGSSRFPGKPLVSIKGVPMIVRVLKQVEKVSAIREVIVATDDPRIKETVESHGGIAFISQKTHETGTDRIVEVAAEREADWILNVQGDEPVIDPQDLSRLIDKTLSDPKYSLATLIHPITNESDYQDPNVVKVVLNQQSEALYFSRSPIPYQKKKSDTLWRHIGVYLYKRDFLIKFSKWKPTQLEATEQLEQLRVLEHGFPISCVPADNPGVGVDVPSDIKKVEALIP